MEEKHLDILIPLKDGRGVGLMTEVDEKGDAIGYSIRVWTPFAWTKVDIDESMLLQLVQFLDEYLNPEKYTPAESSKA